MVVFGDQIPGVQCFSPVKTSIRGIIGLRESKERRHFHRCTDSAWCTDSPWWFIWSNSCAIIGHDAYLFCAIGNYSILATCHVSPTQGPTTIHVWRYMCCGTSSTVQYASGTDRRISICISGEHIRQTIYCRYIPLKFIIVSLVYGPYFSLFFWWSLRRLF